MRRWPALTLAAALLVAAVRAEDDQYLSEAIDRATNGGRPKDDGRAVSSSLPPRA